MLIECGPGLMTRFLNRGCYLTAIIFILIVGAIFAPVDLPLMNIIFGIVALGFAISVFKLGYEWNQPFATDEDRRLIKQKQIIPLGVPLVHFILRLIRSRGNANFVDLIYIAAFAIGCMYTPFFLGRFIYHRLQERTVVPPNM